jgi:hypothetical protein
VRNAQRASTSPPFAAAGDVEVLEELADAGAVDAARGGLPVGAEAVALPPQAAVSRLTASTTARVGRFTFRPVEWRIAGRSVQVSATRRSGTSEISGNPCGWTSGSSEESERMHPMRG